MGRRARLVEPRRAGEHDDPLPTLDVAAMELPPAAPVLSRAYLVSLALAGPLHLAVIGAFLMPVRPREGTDLVQGSIAALDAYWGRLLRMYGDGGATVQLATTEDVPLSALTVEPAPLDQVIDATLATVFTGKGAAE